MRKAIEDLADPFHNFVNISLSRIKRAFGESFCRQIAQNYYITGNRGDKREITLNRNGIPGIFLAGILHSVGDDGDKHRVIFSFIADTA